MNFQETPVVMHCAGEPMVGVASLPEQPFSTGLVVVVGGPQYRAGSHRQFLSLARYLASAGYAVLRFDYRGMGDSAGTPRGFDAVNEDIALAMRTLRQLCPQVTRVALWGLCDGASAALMYWDATRDPLVNGVCALNPWVRSEASLARMRIKHYYGARLLLPELWRKVLRGEFEWRRSISSVWHSLMTASQTAGLEPGGAPFQRKMATAWRQFPGKILLVLSGSDYTAKEFVEYVASDPHWSNLLARDNVKRVDVAGADHTFSKAQWQLAAQQATLEWMNSLGESP